MSRKVKMNYYLQRMFISLAFCSFDLVFVEQKSRIMSVAMHTIFASYSDAQVFFFSP